MFLVDTHRCLLHDHNQHQTQQTTYFIVEFNIGIKYIKQYYFFLLFFLLLLMGKVEKKFVKKIIFFLKVLVEGLNIIQFSQSKNEGNSKLFVYLVIYGCYGVFQASIELKK